MGDASAVDDGYRVAGVKVVLIIATAMRLDSDFDIRVMEFRVSRHVRCPILSWHLVVSSRTLMLGVPFCIV